MVISDQGLSVTFTDEEPPGLQKVLLRALNTWEPKDVPAWAWILDARVTARLNDIKEKQRAHAGA